jgi:hypothetical protein
MSDLIRAHEGNPDVNINDPGKVHWGKFNLFGKFISSTTQCQSQCRTTNDYEFAPNDQIYNLIFRDTLGLMDTEVYNGATCLLSYIDHFSRLRCRSRESHLHPKLMCSKTVTDLIYPWPRRAVLIQLRRKTLPSCGNYSSGEIRTSANHFVWITCIRKSCCNCFSITPHCYLMGLDRANLKLTSQVWTCH